MELNIRPADWSDLPGAAELIRDQPLFEPYGLTPAGLERSLWAALDRDDQLLVAEVDGSIAGLVWFELRGAFGRSGYLRLLVTEPRNHGKGLGARLLGEAEDRVFAQASDLFLLVNTDNQDARRFYERHGYREVGTIHDYVAPGLHELLLRKSRSAAGPMPPVL